MVWKWFDLLVFFIFVDVGGWVILFEDNFCVIVVWLIWVVSIVVDSSVRVCNINLFL